nr:uncharacterized protein LOC116433419 [Nomia melanderi]
MPIFPRAALRAKTSAPSKEHALPSGKENECPSSSAPGNRRVIVPRRRASLCSNDDRGRKPLLPSKIPRLVSGAVGVERTAFNDRTVTLQRAKLPVVGEKLGSVAIDGNRVKFAGNVDSIGSIARPKSTSTPKDAESSPIPVTVRVASARKPSKPLSSFAGELVCNADYHADLPIIEREREERAPPLSDSFLKQHVNAEQRALVVAFMLHLGTHCRYSSRVVYQAVKLFDAAIDKIRVDTGSVQLTALSSLWIALKTRGNCDKIPTASTMISLAKDLYAGREDLLIRFERKILLALDFGVSFADAYTLLAYHMINYKRCADASQETFEFLYYAGGYAIDLTLLDEQFCRTAVRLVALTAAELVLGIVLDTANGTDEPSRSPRWLFWRGLLYAAGARSGDRFQDEEIDRCRVAMLRCVLMSARRNFRFEVVYKKYSRSRYGRIAESFLGRASTVPLLETFDP